jgi:hypothetical protein
MNKPAPALSTLFSAPVEKKQEMPARMEEREVKEEVRHVKPKVEEKKSSDVWDIPTFLRKKKK